jgi:hypothetical protein
MLGDVPQLSVALAPATATAVAGDERCPMTTWWCAWCGREADRAKAQPSINPRFLIGGCRRHKSAVITSDVAVADRAAARYAAEHKTTPAPPAEEIS